MLCGFTSEVDSFQLNIKRNNNNNNKEVSRSIDDNIKKRGKRKESPLNYYNNTLIKIDLDFLNCLTYLFSGLHQGMGGQHDYFGLWLDSDFGHGHSRARPKCTTYSSPQLSGDEDFTLDSMEVWAVGKPPESEEVRVCSSLFFFLSFFIT